MNKWVSVAGMMIVLAGCASKPTMQSTKAQNDLEEQLVKQVGSGRKADLVESFGDPDWCEQSAAGTETCRFSKVMGEKWIGPKKFQKKTVIKDEIVADFAPNGTLRSFKVNSQR